MCFWQRCRRRRPVAETEEEEQRLVYDPQLLADIRAATTEDHEARDVTTKSVTCEVPPLPSLSLLSTIVPCPPSKPVLLAKPTLRESVSRTSQHWSFSEPSSSSPSQDDEDDDDEDENHHSSSSEEDEEEEDEYDEQEPDEEEDEEDEEEEDLLGWHEAEDEGEVAPLYNIYIDETTMSVRFNTVHQETRETLSERIVRNYVEHTITSGHVICQLHDVLHNIRIPEDASHLMVTFCNFAGDQFSVPFALDHPEDPFPIADTRLITDCQLDELPQTLHLLHRPDRHGPLVEENLTDKMIHFCWKYFHPGFYEHRPYAWTWLSELSDDPDAVLHAKYDHDRFADLQLSNAELIVYSV